MAAAKREGVEYEFEKIMHVDAESFDEDCTEAVATAAEDAGYEYTWLVSGAGHDASYLNKVTETAMIFVPSADGVSHSESEYTEWEEVVAGTEVLLRAVEWRASA